MKLPAWHDRGLQRTNPVHVIEQMARDLEPRFLSDWNAAARTLGDVITALSAGGAHLPAFAIEALKEKGHLPPEFSTPTVETRPGVLGLVVQPETELGLILPLRACEPKDDGWEVDPLLPFQPGAVLDLLVRLVQAAGLSTAGLLPERLAFAFANPLGYRAYGNSMTVAAALAVLDALGGHRSDLFRCACAVVEPGDGDQLHPVGHIRPKLRALFREHRDVSLLIAPAACPELDEFRNPSLTVWEVSNLGDLVRHLSVAGILGPLLDVAPLRRVELQRVQDRLFGLVRRAYRYQEARDLGSRVEECKTEETVPLSLWDGIHGLVAEVARHQGRFVEAMERSGKIHADVLARGRFTSHDEQADAATEYAAALFDLHAFERISDLLEPWARVAEEDPQRLRPKTRIKVLNTLGRALVILGREGWERCFRHSRELQEEIDPGDVNRTLSYHIHGLLRHDRLDEARGVFETVGSVSRVRGFSGWMLRFLRADLARRSGERWRDGEMDDARPGKQWPGHPYAFYCQAVARQSGCPDTAEMLGRAAAFLRADAGGHSLNICSLFASCVDLFAAAVAGDDGAWVKAAGAIRGFLDEVGVGSLREYYGPVLGVLGEKADRAAAEELLRLVPYW
jgi:hypothetical protein